MSGTVLDAMDTSGITQIKTPCPPEAPIPLQNMNTISKEQTSSLSAHTGLQVRQSRDRGGSRGPKGLPSKRPSEQSPEGDGEQSHTISRGSVSPKGKESVQKTLPPSKPQMPQFSLCPDGATPLLAGSASPHTISQPYRLYPHHVHL